MQADTIVGVDIGGTKTHIVAIRAGVRVADQVLPTSEWRNRDAQADAASLAQLIRHVSQTEPQVTVLGAHGCDRAEQCQALQDLLSGHLLGTILVLNDSELLIPAAGYSAGISVIAGTGSIAVTRLKGGSMLTAGGWGWFLGDEGSASGLVRDAAKAIRASLDNGNRPDQLADALMKSLRLEDPTYLGKVLVAEGSAAAIGRHVHAVFSAAEAGSTLAKQVIVEGGQKLAHLVGCLLKQGAHGDCIVAGGGVIARQPSLMRAFENAVRPIAPGWDVSLLTTAPVEGAVRLASQLLQGEAPTNLPAPRWSEQHRTRPREPLVPIGYKRSVG